MNQGYKRLCRVYSEGINRWALMTGNGETGPEQGEIWLNGCQKRNKSRNILWRKYRWHNSLTAFERYRRARYKYSNIRKEDQRS